MYICAINSQKQAFLNREMQVRKGEAVQIEHIEEGYTMFEKGIQNLRQGHKYRGKDSENSESDENEEETIGIKLIVSERRCCHA